jgi:hypothetical protein
MCTTLCGKKNGDLVPNALLSHRQADGKKAASGRRTPKRFALSKKTTFYLASPAVV